MAPLSHARKRRTRGCGEKLTHCDYAVMLGSNNTPT
jgi:hypothetical protein